jgi:uncharacterized surface protein with fasciclin (FAS1) repeats
MSFKSNIVEILMNEPKFGIFVKGLILTGLNDKLNETGPFTIMAPSNLAFTRLPEAKLMEMMKPFNKENLAEILKYHLIEGKMMSESIARFTAVMTIQNQRLRIEPQNFGFKVNGASLQTRNIEASNGVIHGISAVLFPAIATEAV